MPYKPARAFIAWILASGFVKTIERALLCGVIVGGLLLFLDIAIDVVTDQKTKSLSVAVGSLVKATSQLMAKNAELEQKLKSVQSPRASLRPYYLKDGRQIEIRNNDTIIVDAQENGFVLPELLIANKGTRKNPGPLEIRMFFTRKLDASSWTLMPTASDPLFRSEVYLGSGTALGGFT